VPSVAAPARSIASPMACDGTWQIIPPPALGKDSGLGPMSATSSTDVWVLGSEKLKSVVAHWDGLTWGVMQLPRVGSVASYSDIAAASPTDVWVVGLTQATHGADTKGLIEHWNGAAWDQESVPDVGPGGDQLSGVTTGPGGEWAVGNQLDGDHFIYSTLVLQR